MDLGLELRKAGLRATVIRLLVLELFHARPDRGLTADDIYRTLLAQNQAQPLPSIYRALPQLEKAGLLRRSELAEQRGVYRLDGKDRPHDQLICTDCGRSEPLADAEIEGRLEAVARQRGFRAGTHVLALHAACAKPRCEHRPAQPAAQVLNLRQRA